MQKLRTIRPLANPRAASHVVDVPQLRPVASRARARVLCFDIENRPRTYRGYDKTSSDITAIAAAWCDDPDNVMVWLRPHYTHEEMLDEFCALYQQAGIVVGHFIRGHDLGIINMHLLMYSLDLLPTRLTQDTCLDLARFREYSKSLGSLAEVLSVDAPKEPMSQLQWWKANGYEDEGIAEVRRRVVGDVRLNIKVWRVLLERGLLRAPRMWSSGGIRRPA